MKNGPLLTTTAVVLASIGAFVAGRTSAPSAGEAGANKEALSAKIDRSRSAGLDRNQRRPSSRSDARRGSKTGSSRLESPNDEMHRIMDQVDPLARTQAWLDFVNSIDPDNFESVVADFRGSGLTRENMAEYAMLLTAWAKEDPLKALDYAKENTGNKFARNTILTSWAATDPESAIAWADQNHEGEDANPWMVGVIRGIAGSDPVRATELMTAMPRSGERGEALAAVLPTMLSQGADVTKAWIATITDDSLREGAVRRVAEDFARDDPRGTADWLAQNAGDAANRSMDDVMTIWAKEDQNGATAYYNNLPSGDLRTNALRGITNQLAMDDPQAAADFLDTNANDANDRTYQQFVWHSFGDDPALAASYIDRIENTGERDGTYRRMLDGWLRRDFDSASSWIDSTSLPEGVSQHLTRRVEEIQQRQR